MVGNRMLQLGSSGASPSNWAVAARLSTNRSPNAVLFNNCHRDYGVRNAAPTRQPPRRALWRSPAEAQACNRFRWLPLLPSSPRRFREVCHRPVTLRAHWPLLEVIAEVLERRREGLLDAPPATSPRPRASVRRRCRGAPRGGGARFPAKRSWRSPELSQPVIAECRRSWRRTSQRACSPRTSPPGSGTRRAYGSWRG